MFYNDSDSAGRELILNCSQLRAVGDKQEGLLTARIAHSALPAVSKKHRESRSKKKLPGLIANHICRQLSVALLLRPHIRVRAIM